MACVLLLVYLLFLSVSLVGYALRLLRFLGIFYAVLDIAICQTNRLP